MNFHFRINVNNQLGIGHLMRTFRLAKRLKKIGHKCFFYLDYQNKFVYLLKDFKVIYLYQNINGYKNQIKDAEILLTKIKTNKNFVVVDDYRLGEKWERKISSANFKIIVIDDLINKKHFADIYINAKPDFYLDSNYNKENILNKNCKILIGPKYSIIDCSKEKKLKKNKFNLLFYNGGGGNLEQIHNILRFLLRNHSEIISKIKLTIILGPFSTNKKNIYHLAKKNKNIKIIDNSFNINKEISQADLIVGSAGNLVYESAFFNIPTLLFQISKNQITSSESMEKLGHYFILDKKYFENFNKISDLIVSMLKNYSRIKKLSINSKIKIDNKGIHRIIKTINNNKVITKTEYINKKSNKLKIIKVKDDEINNYHFARNLNENREVSSSKNKIKKIDHYLWWFNTNRESYLLLKGQKRMLYIYEETFNIDSKKYSKQGHFICTSQCSIMDVMYALKCHEKIIMKKKDIIMSFSSISKCNKINLNKYFGWKILEKKSNYKSIANKILGKSSKYYYYTR